MKSKQTNERKMNFQKTKKIWIGTTRKDNQRKTTRKEIVNLSAD